MPTKPMSRIQLARRAVERAERNLADANEEFRLAFAEAQALSKAESDARAEAVKKVTPKKFGGGKLMTLAEVIAYIGLSKGAIVRRNDKTSEAYDPLFPRPLLISGHTARWVRAEILAWTKQLPRKGE